MPFIYISFYFHGYKWEIVRWYICMFLNCSGMQDLILHVLMYKYFNFRIRHNFSCGTNFFMTAKRLLGEILPSSGTKCCITDV